jgi:peptidoglycan/LPS O-acetylase OafA/YrhL
MLAAVTAVVVAIGVAAPHVHRLDVLVIQSAPDFAALFALGVLTAGIVRAGDGRRSWPWARMALVLAAAVAGVIAWKGSVWTLDRLFWVDLAVAPAVACLLAGLATGRPAWLLRLLDTRPLRRLGDCSYSLYLVHGPIVVVVYQKAIAGSLGHGAAAFAVAASISVPLAVVCARAFASVFEHPRRTPAVRQSAWYRSERAYRRSTTSPI